MHALIFLLETLIVLHSQSTSWDESALGFDQIHMLLVAIQMQWQKDHNQLVRTESRHPYTAGCHVALVSGNLYFCVIRTKHNRVLRTNYMPMTDQYAKFV